jgi:hypothetical protein
MERQMRLQDVLDVHITPCDPAHPVLCFDESPKQRVGEVCEPIPVQVSVKKQPLLFDTY